jgi:hypothetical protein
VYVLLPAGVFQAYTSSLHNTASGTTDAYGGNIGMNNAAILNLSGGLVSNGFSYYRGGNISLKVGTMVLDGVQVYGGMVDETKQDKGSNIYVEGGELTIKGATTIAGGLDVNNAADKPLVVSALKAMTESGMYPDGLWG